MHNDNAHTWITTNLQPEAANDIPCAQHTAPKRVSLSLFSNGNLMLTIAVIEDNAGKVVEAKVLVDGCLGLQVVLVLAMVLVQLVQHRLVCALKTYIG